MDVTNGEVGFQRSGRLTETVTESNLICWFDADGRMIGGGMISFTYELGENLPTITLPAGTLMVEEEAFAGTGIQSVVIPDSCTVIGPRAFADCAALKRVYIPASVTGIAPDAFENSDPTIFTTEGSKAHAFAQEHELNVVLQ